VTRDPQQPGDITAARRLDVSGDLVARRHHVLAQAYDNPTPARQELLSRMACFRGAVDYDTLEALAAQPEKRSFLDRLFGRRKQAPTVAEKTALRADLQDLVARGLLHHDWQTHRYDLHPIVRRYAYDRLGGAEREVAHGQLRDYFAAVPPPERVQRLEDLASVIELYHHTVRAGQYDEAWTLYRDRLWRTVYYQLGAYQTQIELLRALFLNGEEKLPQLTDEAHQAHALNELANSYSLSGQPRRAVPLFEQMNVSFEKRGDKRNLATGLGNLATQQTVIGALQAAEANLRRALALDQELEDEYSEAIEHQELGRLLAYRGVWEEAEEELTVALALFEKQKHAIGEGVTWAYQALRALLLARWTAIAPNPQPPISSTPDALAAARRALELTDEWARTQYPVEREYVRAHWLLGAAHRANSDPLTGSGQGLDEADRHLSEALTRCRSINMVDHEANILLDLARLRAAMALTPGPSPASGGDAPQEQGGRDEALRLAQEALVITERCGYVLQGADVHLFLAQMALEDGDEEAALEHAREARRLAACDGPPDYTYKVAYDEAGALL
jgi:tetratricopeptide (TPR) repeat protein